VVEPVVRDATPDDAPDIAHMHVESWRVAYAHIIPASALALLSVPGRAEGWAQALRDPAPGQWTLVAARGGEIVGFATGGPDRAAEPTAASELYGLYVAPAVWEAGVGTRLMKAGLARLERPAVVWVLEENDRARRFYEARGWRVDDARQPIALLGGAAHPIEVRYRYGGRTTP
jgi:ribosomal protein S18 acetylase RimI-like enzyme